jgi:hypothetical protein
MNKFHVCLTAALLAGSSFFAHPSRAETGYICIPGSGPVRCDFLKESYDELTGLCSGRKICRGQGVHSDDPYSYYTDASEQCENHVLSYYPGSKGICHVTIW